MLSCALPINKYGPTESMKCNVVIIKSKKKTFPIIFNKAIFFFHCNSILKHSDYFSDQTFKTLNQWTYKFNTFRYTLMNINNKCSSERLSSFPNSQKLVKIDAYKKEDQLCIEVNKLIMLCCRFQWLFPLHN